MIIKYGMMKLPNHILALLLGAILVTGCEPNADTAQNTEQGGENYPGEDALQDEEKYPGEDALNFVRVGTGTTADGATDRNAYSKMGPWPGTDGSLLYSGCYEPAPLVTGTAGADRCFMTIDLSDPENPVRLATVQEYDLVQSPSPSVDHVVWSEDYPFPNLPVKVPCTIDWDDPEIATAKKAPDCWDPGWNTHAHSVALGPGKILAVNQERYRGGTTRQANFHGVMLYDVADPARPIFLSRWDAPASPPDPLTGVYPDSRGTHHFNFAGDYLYLGTEYEGFIGRILVILDVSDPKNPREASKWWIEGQKTPEEDSVRDWAQAFRFNSPVVKNEEGKWTKHVGMHYVTLHEDSAYLSYNQAGLVILDIKDPEQPKLISRVDYLIPGAEQDNPDTAACRAAAGGKDAACGNAHSAKRIPGRDLLIMSDEYFTCPYGHVRIYDIADESRPRLISRFLTENTMDCDPAKPAQARDIARFPQRGPSSHIGNAVGSDLYFMAWYGDGVRAIDISDPTQPREVGHYSYDIGLELGVDEPRFHGTDTYDVIIGPKGHLYVSDGTSGLRVLRYTGPGASALNGAGGVQ